MSKLDDITDTHDAGIEPNAKRLLWAGFMAIFAAGVGFAIRGGILAVWRETFGFTELQVGLVNGAGFTGFCFGILIGGLVADKIGYGRLVAVAFCLHVVSALVTFGASDGMSSGTAFVFLWTGTFLFALANGTLEAVANPLVATLFPKNRTHYLNILHASWPAGMVLGGMAGAFLGSKLDWGWKLQLSLFLIPTLIYGFMFLSQKYPKSEAAAKGLNLGDMLKDVGVMGSLVIGFFMGLFLKDGLGPLLSGLTGSDFFGSSTWTWISVAFGGAVFIWFSALSKWAIGAWLLCLLFATHALVGAVELGTDGWMQNFTGNILTEFEGKILFVFTAAIMFGLRFCAHFIEKNLKMSPIGILLVCAMLATLGLNMTSAIAGFGGAMGALAVYAVGKTFFWPTMLAVVSDRFPATGAVAISIMGGIGMMSAGLIGSPGLGYFKDRYAGEELKRVDAALYEEYKAEEPSKFTVFAEATGLDGKKLGKAKDAEQRTEAQQKVVDAEIMGARKTLKVDSLIPAAMAVVYLLLLIWFKMKGGYKPVEITREQIAGGVEGPMEA